MRNTPVKIVSKGKKVFGKIIATIVDFPGYYSVFLVRSRGEDIPIISYKIEFLD
jgi:hypothetical protein